MPAPMGILTVHDLPNEVYRALCVRAARLGRSVEAEVRAILEEAVKLDASVKLRTLLTEIGREACLRDEEFTLFSQRDRTSETASRLA